ncbi:hypothetical protein TRVL_08165 [Trypanosoma vivax]|nr:hypothetical protein TRVL_08165 [Trypanosoma vivax]
MLSDCDGRRGVYPPICSSSTLCAPYRAAEGVGVPASSLALLFYSRLACGDELPDLIRFLRHQLQDVQGDSAACEKLLPNDPPPPRLVAQDSDLPFGLETEKGALIKSKDVKPAVRVEQSSLLHIAKTALLFSVESDEARDETTRFVYDYSLIKLFPNILGCDHGKYLAIPRKIDYILSDRVAVSYARKWASEGRWEEAARLLSHAPERPMTLAASVELFSSAGHWRLALERLAKIPPMIWTEVEVSAAIRSIFRASHVQGARLPQLTDSPSLTLWSLAVHVLTMVHTNGVHLTTPSAVNDTLAVVAVDGGRWACACRIVDQMLIRYEGLEDVSTCASAKETLICRKRTVQPNVVSVYHVCRALRQHWHLALYYAALMMQQANIDVAGDREATQRLLSVCISGNRWVEAMQTMHQRLKHGVHDAEMGMRDYVRADVFLNFLRLLRRSRKGSLASQLLQQGQFSKYFSTDTRAKAYNVVLRGSNALGEAQSWLQVMKCKNLTVENESYEHLLFLYAREGEWRQSLSIMQMLMNDPKRKHLYIPSTKAHNAVQYALERAPQPGPSWRVSVQLFSQACAMHVPVSSVAFQCTVKKCLSQNMSEQAQSIFAFVMQRGVHR